jgi:pimeloyl-ACP methyl ester carboxylesterase
LNATVNLSTHISDIANLIGSHDLFDVVLCGHSYGGLVITGVADQMSERISALVYLDALVPEDGQSMFDTIPQDIADGFRTQAAEGDSYSVPPMTAEQFNVNEADAKWMNQKCTNHPLASFTENLTLSGHHLDVPRSVYVLAAGFDHPGTKAAYESVKAKSGWKSEVMQGGHDLMLDNPDEVAEVLLACV